MSWKNSDNVSREYLTIEIMEESHSWEVARPSVCSWVWQSERDCWTREEVKEMRRQDMERNIDRDFEIVLKYAKSSVGELQLCLEEEKLLKIFKFTFGCIRELKKKKTKTDRQGICTVHHLHWFMEEALSRGHIPHIIKHLNLSCASLCVLWAACFMLLTKISFTVQLMQWRKHGTCQALPFFMACTVILASQNQLIQTREQRREEI